MAWITSNLPPASVSKTTSSRFPAPVWADGQHLGRVGVRIDVGHHDRMLCVADVVVIDAVAASRMMDLRGHPARSEQGGRSSRHAGWWKPERVRVPQLKPRGLMAPCGAQPFQAGRCVFACLGLVPEQLVGLGQHQCVRAAELPDLVSDWQLGGPDLLLDVLAAGLG
jgi:hypothetical protein